MEKKCFSNGDQPTAADGREHPISVLLVDDNIMVRKGVRKIINGQEDMIVIGEASNGEEAVKLARQSCPQVVVMDVNMPIMDGMEATQKIIGTMPEIRVVGLSLHDSQEVVDCMRNAGASAYIMKQEASDKLSVAIRDAAKVVEQR